jgi:3-methyl-2-oxobutanoate hydroxymethyltransferase
MQPSYLTQNSNSPLTHLDLLAMKQRGEKITCLTAYDASFSALIDAAGIEIILVGDSLGMVIQGYSTTLPVKIEDMIYHTRCVTKTCKRALVISDLPFMTYATPEMAAQNAAVLIQSGGAQMVKLEGTKIDVIQFLVAQGISVCGHLGLLPQSIHQLGGYKVQGKVAEAAEKLLADALAIQNAGAAMLLLECVPANLARQITEQLTIPVIGIGAGISCDGQVLVVYDMLGISTGKRPRFSKNFLSDTNSIESALKNYSTAVKQGDFPAIEHSF